MNIDLPSRKSHSPQKRRSMVARGMMLLVTAAYVFSALNLAPLVFVVVGLSLDSSHSACVKSVDGSFRVVIAHSGSHVGHAHHDKWISRLIVGNGEEGHPDHVADFGAAQTGVASSSDELDLKCPVSDLLTLEWLPMVAGIQTPMVLRLANFESFGPSDIRPIRPVVWLI